MEKVKTETMVMKRAGCGVAVAVVAAFFAGSVCAEQYVYPNKGQSADKQEKDKYSCYQWAKGQTGVDPMQQAQTSEGRPVARGAAKGAAGGAIIGAVAGNAGKGAAIGAATGGVVSGARKRRGEKAAAGQRSEYDRAWGACMEGKGYTVK